MLRFILKRLLIFVPTFFVITLLAFALSEQAPGDPVQNKLQIMERTQGGSPSTEREIQKLTNQLGLDKPSFYLSLNTLADSDTLYRVLNKSHREALHQLTRKTGNWEAVSDWYLLLAKGKRQNPDFAAYFERIQSTGDLDAIKMQIDSLPPKPYVQGLSESFDRLKNDTEKWKLYIPSFSWFGANNRYHDWLFGDEGEGGVIRGDFGVSYDDGQEVSAKIWKKLALSVELILIAIILGYAVSLPIGAFSAKRRNSIADRSVSVGLYALYSLPNFFVGTLLLFLFSNPDYLVWFEGSGFKDPNLSSDDYYSLSYFGRLSHSWPYMILPIVTYTYSSLAFISRVVRSSLLENMSADYIRTARAKGLSESKVIWKHAMRNSLLPVITMFSSIFPAAVGGSVIIEFIFGYPGMGQLSIEAIRNNDYPVLISIFTLAGFMTMIGYLVADLLYAFVDPRISYGKKT